jgi:hypothetical protein
MYMRTVFPSAGENSSSLPVSVFVSFSIVKKKPGPTGIRPV